MRSRLDREVRELLRDDPELIAIAESIASLRPEDVDSGVLAQSDAPRSALSRAGRALF